MNWILSLLASWAGISKKEQQEFDSTLPETTAIINILSKASPTIQKLLPIIQELQPYVNELIPHLEKAEPEWVQLAPVLERLVNDLKLGAKKPN